MNNTPTIYVNQVSAIIRHLLTAVSGWLLTRGWLSAEHGTQLVEVGAGALMFALTVGWSLWQKHRSKKVLVVALAQAEMSENQAEKVAASDKPTPTVMSPPAHVPVVPVAKG